MKKKIVIAGGGHAGVEAALAIAQLNCKAIIITMDKTAIARMSCNPAIGGLAKGHLVKEIDALGGIMGYAADLSTLQHKVLNKSKGRAVWAPRAQVDKIQYSQFVSGIIKANSNIDVLEGEVVDFKLNKHNQVQSVILRDSTNIDCNALIITAGTFLNGLIHIGNHSFAAGRMGEKPSIGLTQSLEKYGLQSNRLKTGTPPRLLASSINWSLTELAPGDENVNPFSLRSNKITLKNEPCHIVNTNKNVHDTLNENLNKSAMFSGKIKGVGPRYCPSIEDKIVRFASRDSHQLFLEPEWHNSKQIYVNGFSTSMPEDVQIKALRSIDALKNVELIRPGYAIEYDYIPSSQLKSTLECKSIKNIYLAGQINGTSGYEEAAAQGLIAGINAGLKQLKQPPFILKRSEAYIGVLIDDLITKTINEPYRMFTSRAEYRLSLRADTSYLRLSDHAYKINLLDDTFATNFFTFRDQVTLIKELLNQKVIINDSKQLPSNFLMKNSNSINDLISIIPALSTFSKNALFTAETDIKYSGYVKIERKRVEKMKSMENQIIPDNFDYNIISSLSNESKQKLNHVRPETIGQASRIDGVRTSDISLLCIILKQANVSRETL